MKFRPDVTLYPARDFFPGFREDVLVSEDFAYAMHESAGPTANSPERPYTLACGALWLSALHAADVREHPEALLVQMINPEDPDPIPLLLSRTACGKLILGVLSDARPDRNVNPDPTRP